MFDDLTLSQSRSSAQFYPSPAASPRYYKSKAKKPKVPGYRKRKGDDMKQILGEYLEQWQQNKSQLNWDEAEERSGMTRKQINKYLHDQNKKERDQLELVNQENITKGQIIWRIIKVNRDQE